ncbi:MAG: histidine phosphatase family protein [Chloroflexi bacterium]|nr:histidine phosphatase family protein [Chloroflexota bacterium]
MSGTPVRLALVRHGETVANVEGRWQGQSDSALTERGVEQSRSLAQALADEPLAAIYSSDLGRAMATARIVAERCGVEVIRDPRLREIDTGRWTGQFGFRLRQEEPLLLEEWRLRPAEMRLPGGEGLADVQARVLDFCRERLPRHRGEDVLVMAHGTLNQTLLVHALGQPLTDLWLPERIDNCQVSRLTFDPPATWQVLTLAETRHLERVGSLRAWRAADLEQEERR